jgi:hypothetical protein
VILVVEIFIDRVIPLTEYFSLMTPLSRLKISLVLAFTILLVLVPGCINKEEKSSGLVPISPEPNEEQFRPISLDEGLILMNNLDSREGGTTNATAPLYFIKGRNVNSDGKAEQWIFGTELNKDYYFILVESNRQVLIPFEGKMSQEKIEADRIMKPSALILKNRGYIMEKLGIDTQLPLLNLELNNNVYTVTLPAGTIDKILSFNAFSGEPL